MRKFDPIEMELLADIHKHLDKETEKLSPDESKKLEKIFDSMDNITRNLEVQRLNQNQKG